MSSTQLSLAHMEALQWLARMDGEESPADRLAFDHWRADPLHAAAFAEGEQLWRDARSLAGRADMAPLVREARMDAAGGGFIRSRWSWGIAATVTVCIFAVGAFLIGQHYVPSQTYVTGPAQRSTVELEDGSRVILNVGTRLDVRFGKRRRQLTLKAGEAVFSVAQDLRRPFTVMAGDGEVTALGTRFQVRKESRRVTVTLLEGRLALDRKDLGPAVQLNPGDQVGFAPDKPGLARRIVDLETTASWTTGRLKFRATALAEVLAEVNRYAKPRIRLENASLAQTPVNGMFEMGNSAAVVSALEVLLPLQILRQDADEIVLTQR